MMRENLNAIKGCPEDPVYPGWCAPDKDGMRRIEDAVKSTRDFPEDFKIQYGCPSPPKEEAAKKDRPLASPCLLPYVHELKSWTMFFEDIMSGARTSDIRFTGDRRFKVGDTMILREWDPVVNRYTGRAIDVTITYIQQNKSNPCAISHQALNDDYAVLSIKLKPKTLPTHLPKQMYVD